LAPTAIGVPVRMRRRLSSRELAGTGANFFDEAQAGDQQAAAADLLPLVYAELHHLARARLARQTPGQTLRPTCLVHEAYLLGRAGAGHATGTSGDASGGSFELAVGGGSTSE
jgi:hypothetical protein